MHRSAPATGAALGLAVHLGHDLGHGYPAGQRLAVYLADPAFGHTQNLADFAQIQFFVVIE